MKIGEKIKTLRLISGLTQEELADRCELTKGYISQLENDLTSPAITTLVDILQSLGSSLGEFFSDIDVGGQTIFKSDDMFEKDHGGYVTRWLVPTAQKNAMEPILTTLAPGAETERDLPHDGEEFGFVLSGEVAVIIGKKSGKARVGDSFYFRSGKTHYIKNTGKSEAKLIWVSCPPNF